MANIKSAKKRIKVIATKTARNKDIKSKVKTDIKKVVIAAGSGTKAEAQERLLIAISEIDKAKSKGVINKSAAARKISRLTKLVNKTA